MMMSGCNLQSENQISDIIKRWPTPASKVWTLNFINTARNDKNIIAVVAIGSSIRPHVHSIDLDLLVICQKIDTLNAKSPLEIDLRAYAVSDVNNEIAQGNDLLGWAVKFGRVIFQRERYWDLLVKSWENTLPLPSVTIFEKRSRESLVRLRKVYEVGDINAAQEQALSYVTHLGRVELLKRKIYPASRPELPGQLRSIGCHQLADWLERLMDNDADHSKLISELIENTW